jgi:subtilisin-like proprotein convertase family protein
VGAASPARAITLANPTPIAINDATGPAPGTPAAATPYPSPIAVSGLVGNVAKVTVTLHGFHHTCAHDVDLLLVAPQGQESILMSDAGDCDVGSSQPPPVELAFDDSSSVPVPCLDGPSELLASGTYATTNDPTAPNDCTSDDTHPDVFAAPAPAAPYALGLAGFAGAAPNGAWNLYAMDQFADDSGAIDNGWSLDLAIPPGTLGSAPAIKGAAESGRTLTAISGALGNGAAPAYQWSRCAADGSSCKPIASATGATYRPTRADRGHTLGVTETAVTSGGASAPRDSAHTTIVGPALLSVAGTRLSQSGRHGVRIILRSNVPGKLTASATVGRAKLRGALRTLRAGRRATLRLALTPASRRAIADAKRPRVRVKLVVTDAGGARSTKRLTVRLR